MGNITDKQMAEAIDDWWDFCMKNMDNENGSSNATCPSLNMTELQSKGQGETR